MYWRVRKTTPEQMIKQYGVYVGLAISLFANFLLVVTRPQTPKMSAEVKQTAEAFCKQVTQHLLDTSYIGYMDATSSLQTELSPKVLADLQTAGLIPKSGEDLRAQLRALTDRREVASVKVESVQMRDPPSPNAPTPVDVKGIVAIHSSQDTSATEPVPFYFRYHIGAKVQQNGQPELVNGVPVPMVASFEDLSSAKQ